MTLTASQRNYDQIQKEALVIYALNKFFQYLYGRKFILVTDHQPVVAMFGPNKPTPALGANRLSRWALISSTIKLHHRVPKDVGTLQCWCPQSTACRWRSQFRQGRKYRRRGHRLYHRNTEFAGEINRLGYVAERVFSKFNFAEGHAFHERRLAREKRRRWPSREIPENRQLTWVQ